jgi:hypothetical protein
MTARQQLARLLPSALLIILAMAGLRGTVAAPRWNGPLRGDGVAIGLILEVVLGVLLVMTLRRERAARGTGGLSGSDDGREDDGRRDVPGALRFVLIRLLAAGMAAVAVVLLVSLHLHVFTKPQPVRVSPQPLPSRRVPQQSPHAAGPGPHIPIGPILYGVAIAALVAAVVISIWWSARLRRPAEPPELTDLASDSEDLRDAVASGRAALAELDDARAAIIACYLAMERSLAERGTARAVADTPDELLARAVATGIARGTAARRLTALFYEARFSSHPLGPGQREAARRALDELAAELRESWRHDGAEAMA